jgi:hypothetical protein
MMIVRDFRCNACGYVFEDTVDNALPSGTLHETGCVECGSDRCVSLFSVPHVTTLIANGPNEAKARALRKRQYEHSIKHDLTPYFEARGRSVPKRFLRD